MYNRYYISRVRAYSNLYIVYFLIHRCCGRAVAQSLASHCGGPGSRPGLASGICDGQSCVGAGFLRILRFPLPKPFILPTSSSLQSPVAVSRDLAKSPKIPAKRLS
jgi:hypothetical protein